MDVAVTTEQRMYRTPDGVVWSPLLHGFWRRYTHAFSGVHVLARVFDVDRPEDGWGRVEEDAVRVAALPPFDGLMSLAARYRAFRERTDPLASSDAAVLLRLPSVFAGLIGRSLARAGKPFGAEIVGDPGQALGRGSVRHPARVLLRRLAIADQRRLCRQAWATAYVTETTLQRSYPPGVSRFTTHCSDIELGDDDYVAAPRAQHRREQVSLVHVGTFSQPYKGQDLLVRAVDLLRGRGLAPRVTLVGDGRYRSEVEAAVRRRGLDPAVEFTGEIRDRAELRRRLDDADLFVLPSRTEGLPRVLIEAMARALPCIATRVGGIPELLPPEVLCSPDDASSLAAKIAEVMADPERMQSMGAANLAKSRQFHREVLRPRGERFQEHVRDGTAAWLAGRSRP
jgi:glycosyltransferase involved in cell wall biosynthesis